MTYIHRLRLRVLAWLFGIALAGIAAVSWMALPAWPVLGVTVAVLVATVSTVTNRLKSETCYACGQDLREIQPGVYGRACPGCGAFSFTLLSLPTKESSDWPDDRAEA